MRRREDQACAYSRHAHTADRTVTYQPLHQAEDNNDNNNNELTSLRTYPRLRERCTKTEHSHASVPHPLNCMQALLDKGLTSNGVVRSPSSAEQLQHGVADSMCAQHKRKVCVEGWGGGLSHVSQATTYWLLPLSFTIIIPALQGRSSSL